MTTPPATRTPFYDVEGRNYLYMFTHVLPALTKMGVADRDIERIMRDNPRRMLEV